jgi:hypothetical protein
MKTNQVVALALTGQAFVMISSHGQGLTLNFSSNPGSTIEFGGASHYFEFTDGTGGNQWTITSVSGGATSAVSFQGDFNNGPFYYGSIASSLGGIVQSATVTTPGDLVISDGTGNLTALINWIDVTTVFSSVGAVNSQLQINLSDVTYTGSNPDLQQLVSAQPDTLNLAFQFNPGETLTQLSTGPGGLYTSYSGSIAAAPVPEPATLALSALGGLGGLGLHLLRRRNSPAN